MAGQARPFTAETKEVDKTTTHLPLPTGVTSSARGGDRVWFAEGRVQSSIS